MKIQGMVVILAMACAASLAGQETFVADAVFAEALNDVQQELQGAPPLNLQHEEDGRDLPTSAIVVAGTTIGGAPRGLQSFVDKFFGEVIAEDLAESYGDSGPTPRAIEQKKAGRFTVLPLEEFEIGRTAYDWKRLNEKYPDVRHVVRVSWPVLDKVGTYAVVRYELIGRDRPAKSRSPWPWQHASFVKFEKQNDGSWKRGIARIGPLWE